MYCFGFVLHFFYYIFSVLFFSIIASFLTTINYFNLSPLFPLTFFVIFLLFHFPLPHYHLLLPRFLSFLPIPFIGHNRHSLRPTRTPLTASQYYSSPCQHLAPLEPCHDPHHTIPAPWDATLTPTAGKWLICSGMAGLILLLHRGR